MIWLVWLRIEPLPGCKVAPESGEPTLECALSAATKAEVRASLDAALRPSRYRVAEIEACVEFEPRAWHSENDPDGRVRAAAAAVSSHGAVRFASFGRAPPETAREHP